MAFTEYGKKLQRKDVTTHFTTADIILKGQDPVSIPGDRIEYRHGTDGNPIEATLVVHGNEVGIGNTVTGINLVDPTANVFEHVFAVENTCVTDQDTFTITLLIGN